MADPLSIAALSAAALTEGIKFLYDQAREVLKGWRERRDRGDARPIQLSALVSEALDAPLAPTTVRVDLLAQHAETLTALRRALVEYAEEGAAADPADRGVLESVDALRRLLEVLYGQRITFRDEAREHTGTRIDSDVEAGVVRGRLAAVRLRGGIPGDLNVVARTKVDQVDATADVVGVELESGRRDGHGDQSG